MVARPIMPARAAGADSIVFAAWAAVA